MLCDWLQTYFCPGCFSAVAKVVQYTLLYNVRIKAHLSSVLITLQANIIVYYCNKMLLNVYKIPISSINILIKVKE